MTSLWAAVHVPRSEADLVVTKKRVTDVQDFLLGRLGSNRRVLLLKGPAGCGKASVLRALCGDLKFDVAEWDPATCGGGPVSDTFLRFLAQADRYRTLGHDGQVSTCISRPRVTLVRDFPFTLLSQQSEGQKRGAAFVERFQQLMKSGTMQRAVFCFNDTFDDYRTYNRLFSSPEMIATITFDGVPRTFAQKALEGILRAEAIDASGVVDVPALAAECGGDLRHAINALQCLAAGLPRISATSAAPAKRARGKGRAKAVPTPQNCGGVIASTTVGAHESGNRPSENRMRGATLGLFHGVGRLLYCKRVPPEGSLENSQGGSQPAAKRARKAAAANEPKQLPHHMLVPKSSRPPLYFVPEEVLDSTNSEPGKVVEWLFTNAPRYYDDVTDLAEFVGSMAEVDGWGVINPWANTEELQGMEMDHFAAVVQVRALLDCNLHPVPPTFADPCSAPHNMDIRGSSSFNHSRPLMMDVHRHREQRRDEIGVHLEEAGALALGSPSLTTELLTRTLPFAHLMLVSSRGTHPFLSRLPHGLMKLMMDLTAPVDGDLFRAASGRGPVLLEASSMSGQLPEDWSVADPDDPIED